ncbi:MAG TPA: alpha/beta fold hydrolase [Rubrivivax sp.]|nr:alpha/beta fold hydrolase [Rubrivivax sp.]
MTMARVLQTLTLALAVSLLLVLAGWLWWGLAAWLGVGLLLLALLHLPLMAAEFVLARLLSRGDPAPVPRLPEMLRAWGAEVAGAVRVFGWAIPWRWRRYPDHLPAGAAGRRGLVLVHGFVCNRGIWNPWWPRLRALGVPCIAVNLEPVFGAIDRYPASIEAAVQRLTHATGQPPLLVAHSMGGLAVRAWMRDFDGESRVHGVVTIGTPHHGTWLGRFGFAPNTRQMRRDSRWLQALAAAEPATRYRRFTCFWGHCDNIVFPASTATLPGADNRHLRAHAHVHMLQHPAVLATVLQRLAEPARGPQLSSRAAGSAC